MLTTGDTRRRAAADDTDVVWKTETGRLRTSCNGDVDTADLPEPFVEYLVDQVAPHARAEEIFLYPIVEQLMGSGTTATMRIDHEAIVGRIHRIRDAAQRGLLIEGGWHAHEELRRLCIELGALLDVHFDKEERVYLPLLERKLDAPEQERLVEAMEMAA